METIGRTTTTETTLTSNILVFTTIQPSIGQSVEVFNETISYTDRVTDNSKFNPTEIHENQIERAEIENATQNVKYESTTPVLNNQPISHPSNFINISIDSSNKIKFEITNFTNLDTNTADSKSYALRIHLKGFQWNEKYNDVNSSESINFLQGEIIPLLMENLNLSSDELHGVRLMKLFKGSVQSEVIINTKNSFNHKTMNNNVTEIDSDKHLIGNTTYKAVASKLIDATNEFDLKIISGFDVNNRSAYLEIIHLVCI
jgi:hypothetical protein